MTTEPDLRARNLRTLALLAALFVVPLALAFFTYYGTSWRPLARVNHGELIIACAGAAGKRTARRYCPRRRRRPPRCSATSGRWSTSATAAARMPAGRRCT